MRFEGSLILWNAERGYGEILPLQGGQPLFVHVSAFPKDGEPPSLDEVLSFEVVSGRDGRKDAVRVLRAERSVATPAERLLMAAAPQRVNATARREQQRRRIAFAALGLCLAAAALGGYAWRLLPG